MLLDARVALDESLSAQMARMVGNLNQIIEAANQKGEAQPAAFMVLDDLLSRLEVA